MSLSNYQKKIKSVYKLCSNPLHISGYSFFHTVHGISHTTGEVTSKVAVVMSISRPFWHFCVGLPTIHDNYVSKPTYTHDNRNLGYGLACTYRKELDHKLLLYYRILLNDKKSKHIEPRIELKWEGFKQLRLKICGFNLIINMLR